MGFLLLIQVVLIALNAIFASAEIAVLSLNETKLEKMAEGGNKRARRLRKLTGEPARFLATIQVAITLSGFLGSAFAADNFSGPLVDWLISLGVGIPRGTLSTLSVIVITLILSYFTLIFGELVPKRIAMKKSEQLALGISGLVCGISVAFKPIVWLLSVSTNAILRLMGIDPQEDGDQVSEEEIRMMVDAGSERGTIDVEEKEFIKNVFEFDDLTAGEICTHRTDVVILWAEDDMDEWAKTIHDSRHTLYPVCDESPDNVLGVLNAKDYFRMDKRDRESVMAAVRPAYFVPETVKADVLFRNLKLSDSNMAVVLDEYGGMVGIVTMNDLVEELVGSLGSSDEEARREEPHLERIAEDRWSVSGNVELSDIEDATGLNFDAYDCDTLTGLVFDALNRVPEDGPCDMELDVERLHIRVSLIADHQVERAEITLLPPAPSEEEDD